MVGVITTAPLKKFLDAVSYVRGDNEMMMENLSSSAEIAIKHADYVNDCRKYGIEPEVVFRLVYDETQCTGGYCVINGELCCFWSIKGGRGLWLLDNAISDGAIHLNCFDGYLTTLYSQRGFKEYKRLPNWNTNGPDVVYMNKGEPK
jgi:hypothetical protein